jgi:hypothetical protein
VRCAVMAAACERVASSASPPSPALAGRHRGVRPPEPSQQTQRIPGTVAQGAHPPHECDRGHEAERFASCRVEECAQKERRDATPERGDPPRARRDS